MSALATFVVPLVVGVVYTFFLSVLVRRQGGHLAGVMKKKELFIDQMWESRLPREHLRVSKLLHPVAYKMMGSQ